jgi:hypothetical protein
VPDRATTDRTEPDLLQHHVDPPPSPGAAADGARPTGIEQLQVLPSGQVAVRCRAFDQCSHARQNGARRPRHRLPEHLRLTGCREHQAEQHADRRGLA